MVVILETRISSTKEWNFAFVNHLDQIEGNHIQQCDRNVLPMFESKYVWRRIWPWATVIEGVSRTLDTLLTGQFGEQGYACYHFGAPVHFNIWIIEPNDHIAWCACSAQFCLSNNTAKYWSIINALLGQFYMWTSELNCRLIRLLNLGIATIAISYAVDNNTSRHQNGKCWTVGE